MAGLFVSGSFACVKQCIQEFEKRTLISRWQLLHALKALEQPRLFRIGLFGSWLQSEQLVGGDAVELEYVLAYHMGPRCVYELLYRGEGADGSAFLPGLIDVRELQREYGADRSGFAIKQSAHGRGPAGVKSGGSRAAQINPNTTRLNRISSLAAKLSLTEAAKEEINLAPYVHVGTASSNGHGGA